MKKITPYCTAPWNGITVQPDGSVTTCCVGKVSLGNINQQSIIEIINNPTHQRIKQNLLDNTNLKENCQICLDLEKSSGNTPVRQLYLNDYPTLSNKLRFLDIRWTNFCNLTCVYCGSYSSSAWADKLDSNNKKITINQFDSDLESWVLDKADELYELNLVGGEPLLMKQNYNLLAKISDSVRLSLITNLSYNLENLPCLDILLTRPKDNTIWNISAENYGEQFEYIRNGADWLQFEKNIKFLVAQGLNTIRLQMTYGIHSGLNLLDTIMCFYELGIKKFNINPVILNPGLDIFTFPNPVIALALEQLEQVKLWEQSTHGIDYDLYRTVDLDNLIKRMYNILETEDRAVISKDIFVNEIAKYDQWHTKKFNELWPNKYQLIMDSFND
jgi:radical SAM protein with 4Fe4S-binding SPASM domain